jgi:hypothetical protein
MAIESGALKVLKEYGLPTFFAVGIGAMLAWNIVAGSKERAAIAEQAAKERAEFTAIMVDQITDLREKVARLEGICDHGKSQ